MEEKLPSAGQSALYYGLLYAVAAIVLHLVLYLTDLGESTVGMVLGIVVMIGAIVIAQLNYRNVKWGGYITYGKAVKIGFLTLLFSSFIIAIYMYIYYDFINPGEILQRKTEAIQGIYDYGMDPESEDQAVRMQEMVHTPLVYGVFTIFTYAVWGIIISLITAIFIKKEKDASLG